MSNKPIRRIPYGTIIAIVAVGVYYLINGEATTSPTALASRAPAAQFDDRFDGAMIESSGIVVHIMPDGNDGATLQRFVVLLDGGQTLQVAHNIDLAARIEDLARGDTIKFRGRFEANDHGGVVRWTHHDPRGERAGGWLEHAGIRYR